MEENGDWKPHGISARLAFECPTDLVRHDERRESATAWIGRWFALHHGGNDGKCGNSAWDIEEGAKWEGIIKLPVSLPCLRHLHRQDAIASSFSDTTMTRPQHIRGVHC